ncbi:MAG: hypothetical protein QM734_12670 [Cyclobacteriaceae bacterium]
MKKFIKICFTMLVLVGLITSCEDVQTVTPIPNTIPSTLTANFLLVNASPDAPSLDLYLNNVKTGSSVVSTTSQPSYSSIPITVNASSNNSISNTQIRVKATTNSIGGKLGSNDLIFRAGPTNTNNFQAANGAYYTLVAVDSLNRPSPLRTNNSLGIGDITYFSVDSLFHTKTLDPNNLGVDTVIHLKAGYNSVVIINTIKKYNTANSAYASTGYLPTNIFPIGIVPLGSTDPGGIRFLILSDVVPVIPGVVYTPTTTTGKINVRFINLSPDAELGGAVACTIGGTAVPAASAINSYPMFRIVGTFDPTVGSRSSVSLGFSSSFASTGSLNVVVNVNGTQAASATGVDFTAAGSYTVILTGLAKKGTLKISTIKNF